MLKGKKDNNDSSPKEISNPFGGKKILGDLFGTTSTYDSSFEYRSRISLDLHVAVKRETTEIVKKSTDENKIIAHKLIEDFRSDSDSENEVSNTLTHKQQLALTLRNWAVLSENDQKIIKEGGINTLISLAMVDDPLVKKSCASAFYHLSSRTRNRKDFLKSGAVTGVIAIALQGRSWKVAKLISMCLCNLSMEDGGEAVMIKEGAVTAVQILMTVKGQRLLPICVHILYNLTCVSDYYKGMDRLPKALLNIPNTAFDHTHFLIKVIILILFTQ